MRKTKVEKGITLVALIITIIVLLILAVVAINAVRNDGIIDYAKNARYAYENAQKEEQSYLDYYTSQIQSSTGKGIVHNGIIPKDAKYITSDGIDLQEFPSEPQTGDIYQYGNYEYIYNMYPKKDSPTELYTVKSTSSVYNSWGVRILNSVGRDKAAYGEILTTINNKDVKVLANLFYNCTNLKVAPKIPSTTVIMMNTFYECKLLEKAPDIPDSVTNMSGTFSGCEMLMTAPKIPDNVTNMSGTFEDCYALQKAPVVPSEVTNMYRTFNDCHSLTGEIIIKTNKVDIKTEEKDEDGQPKYYGKCFYGAGSISNNEIILKGIDSDNDGKYDNLELLNAFASTDNNDFENPNNGNVKVHNLTASQE